MTNQTKNYITLLQIYNDKETLLRHPYKTVYNDAKNDKNLMVNANNA